MTLTLSIASADAPYLEGYSQQLSVSGGTPPYTIAVTAGGLPDGLSVWLSDTNVPTISGVPTGVAGISSFTLTLTDATAATATLSSSIVVPAFPTQLAVNFGAKTRGGHGGHYLANAAGGALSITAGNGAGHWAIVDNRLVPAGSYGASPPAFNGPYTLTVANAGTGTSQTVTISIIANSVTVAVGTSSNPDTTTSFQLRTVLASGALVRGDTIVCRTGNYNPTNLFYRVRPAVSYSGSGRIVIASEWFDPSIASNGIKNRRHGARWGQLIFDSTISGDVEMPFDLVNLWVFNNQSTTTGFYMVNYSNSTTGWGVGARNCRFENGPLASHPSDVSGFMFRGSATTAYNCDDNIFQEVQHCIVHGRSSVGGIATGSSICRNVFYDCTEDAIDLGVNSVASVVCNDNFGISFVYYAGAHSDFVQSQGNKTGTNILFGELKRNVLYSSSAAGPQGLFMDDSTGISRFTDAVMENNIIITTAPNAIFLNRFDNPTIRFNTILFPIAYAGASYNPSITVPSGAGGSGGTFTHNIAQVFSLSAQGGSPTTIPNKALAKTLTAYQGAFANWTETGLDNPAAVKAAVVPLLNGTAKNGDGTYNGALKPDGSWNDGAVYP